MNILNNQFDKIEKEEIKMEKQGNFISTGSTLLDLIVGGGAYIPGVLQLFGDSQSGKTWQAVELCYQGLKKYGSKMKLRYLNKEGGNRFDTKTMYGADFFDGNFAENVNTIEDFSMDLLSWARKTVGADNFGIYVVDSWDALGADDERNRIEERLKAHDKGKEFDKKSYGAEKAKFGSEFFRNLIGSIHGHNILLIIISQIRDNMNAGMFAPKTSVSGGHAPKFYSDQRLELKVREDIEGEGRKIGQTVCVDAIKTRSSMPARKVYVNYLGIIGVDDVGTNVDYYYNLRDDYGKLKEASVINNISFKEDAKEVNSTSIKEFLTELELLEDATNSIKSEGKRLDQKNLMEYINSNSELRNKFVEYFGTTDRETLIQHIIDNNQEEEFAQKVIEHYLEVERRIQPNRKKKGLDI